MAKLHELLAVEGQLDGTAKKILAEAGQTFSKKADHFQGFQRIYTPFTAGIENELPSEEKAMVTTVGDKLEYTFEAVVEWLDAVLQKERTNQDACADIVIDDTILATDIPATFLLGLEAKLKEIRETLEHIPTLAPGIVWEADPTQGKGVYRMKNAQERMRTQKITKPIVLYAATDKHPAQVKEVTEDVAIGKYIETHLSGMISPADKSDLLGRIDKLTRAVKQARQRANNTDVVSVKIGSTLAGYILGAKLHWALKPVHFNVP